MTGLDANPFYIKIAKEKALQKGEEQLDYRQQNLSEWKEKQKYDFVYSRLFFNPLSNLPAILKSAHTSLKTGGFAVFENFDFSQFHCFPNCYAFDCFVELFTTINKGQNDNPNRGKQLRSAFHHAGFENIRLQQVRPNFLTKKAKHIVSLTLENIAPILIEEKLSTPTELQVLIQELKSFESQKDTMIALPGTYQVWGYRH